jgi:hypothetical protein
MTTVAVIGLLAAPAWAQTMNSTPANSSTMSPPAAGSSNSDIDQSKPSAMPSQGVTRQGMSDQSKSSKDMSSQANDQDQASPTEAAKPTTTRGSGSSAPRHMAKARSSHAGDNNADELNQQELQRLSQSK